MTVGNRHPDSQRVKIYAVSGVLPSSHVNMFGSNEATQKWLNVVLTARWFRAARWKLKGGIIVEPGDGGARAGRPWDQR